MFDLITILYFLGGTFLPRDWLSFPSLSLVTFFEACQVRVYHGIGRPRLPYDCTI